MVLTILAPFFIPSALGAYLFYAQHYFPGVILKDNVGWTYEGAALESSSYLKTNPLMASFVYRFNPATQPLQNQGTKF
jgi:acyl-lipid omega-6 desaturase (Delta-12 desaturase)